MFFYIARQPILDRNKNLYAYELLFRNGIKNAFPDISEDTATASLIDNSQLQFNVADITHGHLAFINFSEQALLNDLPSVMPQQHIVVEVLETVTPSEQIFAALLSLKERGYLIALDDFDFNPAWYKMLHLIDVIKVDLQNSQREQIVSLLHFAKQQGIKLLAEKVETYEEFQTCLQDGFDYFQGYFFAKPEVLQKRVLSPHHVFYMQLLDACAKPEIDFDQVSKIMSHDISLSYKLLRYVNAPIHATSQRIESLRQAVIFLGEEEIKKFVALLAAAQLGTNKPSELIRTAIIRGRMCEQVALATQVPLQAEKAFLIGMFSTLEAILDEPMATIVARIDLSTDMQEALINKKGALAYCLAIVLFYERANWEKVQALSQRLKLVEKDLPTMYFEALNWANSLEHESA